MPIPHPLSGSSLAEAARRAVTHLVKTRARQFARRPFALESLYPGLAGASGATLVAVAEHLLEQERRAPHRWFGFGGEVPAVNAKAARLLGRALRRIETREAARSRNRGGP